MDKLRVFIGWDSREDIAYQVARRSLIRHASVPVEVTPIKLDTLVEDGIYTREIDPLASTEFTYSRFLVPHLAGYEGWALFVDCDFLFFGDVADLGRYMDPDKAVACVQHDYTPKETTKMDGVQQTVYPRKNWSSFMLFNCAHPSTRQLTVEKVNTESGAYLHRMQWAKDDEIGSIPETWNWLDGWSAKPAQGRPAAVHYTSGGPWFEAWQDVSYAGEWHAEADAWRAEA
ncbi:glycosyltransferase [Mesobaculum littorinae]|uniref:Glycosyltransferase n=1 Tax=Mesobaculum littorinae TaxID=2486419 RepID=A0A438AK03_9RHOB|nr:glycosyltransferase [Mesobaculum littorinae]RVV98979.1 glycosyltransferase [Mesobaculum littorinae]